MRESRTYGSGRGACHEMHVPTATPRQVHHSCLAARRGGPRHAPTVRMLASASVAKCCCWLSSGESWYAKGVHSDCIPGVTAPLAARQRVPASAREHGRRRVLSFDVCVTTLLRPLSM